MRFNVLSVATVAAACLFSAVQAQEWNAVFVNNGGFQFLDSNNAKIETTADTSVAAVDANHDKGERFRFPTGTGGILISQAHEDHAVGYDSGANEFHADFAQDHFDALVTVSLNGNQASFCNGDHCIGAGGQPTSEKFMWTLQGISAA
ncbi:uncharacterized protein FOMMEDRAFT_25140 [Fomitiporia mediterranea MF3/22]|uniref:uncharacterized protein n=1 Tax=Fomitiporia mediterranea (strain MF3/22) TaxID=694068 RepID=UPI0004409601|nr:uncharacterized protein FOMMEDRAFT_25140 [Fomitiporia mediterranea MF3/22]EJD07896.1 hypothetical protein FOMMEDRAFT_25140 [Fomitiporia mediterranea MF3/22]